MLFSVTLSSALARMDGWMDRSSRAYNMVEENHPGERTWPNTVVAFSERVCMWGFVLVAVLYVLQKLFVHQQIFLGHSPPWVPNVCLSVPPWYSCSIIQLLTILKWQYFLVHSTRNGVKFCLPSTHHHHLTSGSLPRIRLWLFHGWKSPPSWSYPMWPLNISWNGFETGTVTQEFQ